MLKPKLVKLFKFYLCVIFILNKLTDSVNVYWGLRHPNIRGGRVVCLMTSFAALALCYHNVVSQNLGSVRASHWPMPSGASEHLVARLSKRVLFRPTLVYHNIGRKLNELAAICNQLLRPPGRGRLKESVLRKSLELTVLVLFFLQIYISK